MDTVPDGQPCPRCGSVKPPNQVVRPETAKATAQVFTPSISVEVLWDTASLTFAAVVYTAIITIVGVLVATNPLWPDRTIYAIGSVALFILMLTVLKRSVIRVSRWLVGRLGDGPRD